MSRRSAIHAERQAKFVDSSASKIHCEFAAISASALSAEPDAARTIIVSPAVTVPSGIAIAPKVSGIGWQSGARLRVSIASPEFTVPSAFVSPRSAPILTITLSTSSRKHPLMVDWFDIDSASQNSRLRPGRLTHIGPVRNSRSCATSSVRRQLDNLSASSTFPRRALPLCDFHLSSASAPHLRSARAFDLSPASECAPPARPATPPSLCP